MKYAIKSKRTGKFYNRAHEKWVAAIEEATHYETMPIVMKRTEEVVTYSGGSGTSGSVEQTRTTSSTVG